uniref:Uncharacterized protein n=1 Tax=Caenorhabditis japonica TaxID=281687 RepID=A0A8R1IB36_CAEJA
MHISCVFITILTVSAVSQRLPIAQRSVKETFLVGSEFEQSMVSHLLNSSTTTTLNDDITSLLASTNLTYTLAEPEKPFVWGAVRQSQCYVPEETTQTKSVCGLMI